MPKTTTKQLLNEYLTSGFTGYVYKLSCGDDCYIGSTLRPLKKRLQDHKERHKSGRSKLYELMRKVGFDNFEVEIMEEVKYTDKKQVRMREKYYYDLLKPNLNEISPYLSPEDKKIKDKIRWRKWYYNPETRKEQKEKKRNDYHTKYRDYYMEQIACECGRTVSRKHLKDHLRSNIHRDRILHQQVEDLGLEQIADEVVEIEQQFLDDCEEPSIVKLVSRIKCDELEEVNLDELSI